MPIRIACLVPHPPIIIPEIGGKEVNKIEASVDAMKDLSERLAEEDVETSIVVSPHTVAFADTFVLRTQSSLSGSMARFGANEISLAFPNDTELANSIMAEATKLDIPCSGFEQQLMDRGYSDELDHGVLVPLYYLKEAVGEKIVSLSISGLNYMEHYLFGTAIQKAVGVLGRDVAFIASGDLSHRLTPSAPAGYNERGKIFDREIKEIIQRGSFQDFFELDESLIEDAGECGFRSILMLAGVLDGYEVDTGVLSYEGPFGVGYMVAWAKPTVRVKKDIKEEKDIYTDKQRESSHLQASAPALLAKQSVEAYIKEGKVITPPADLPPFMLEQQSAAFICLKKAGALRGCIGTTEPTQPSLAEEIVKNSVAAATKDPRFPTVEPQELGNLNYTVDVLDEPEKIADESDLDPKNYGVIVESGFHKGLLLPDIEGVDTVADQVAIAKQKAGLSPSESVTLYRFKVTRYK